jgi:hypothetical protein
VPPFLPTDTELTSTVLCGFQTSTKIATKVESQGEVEECTFAQGKGRKERGKEKKKEDIAGAIVTISSFIPPHWSIRKGSRVAISDGSEFAGP